MERWVVQVWCLVSSLPDLSFVFLYLDSSLLVVHLLYAIILSKLGLANTHNKTGSQSLE